MIEIEPDPRLAKVSDTAILLNFAKALQRLYPAMKAVYAHCYDPYDDVVEPLFDSLVYASFAGKYGTEIPRSESQRYGFSVKERLPPNYVRLRPKRLPMNVRTGGRTLEIDAALLAA